MLHTVGRRWIAPVEMCTETQYPCKVMISFHASLCKWMPSPGQSSWFLFVVSTAKMPQYVRGLVGNLTILLFISFGYRKPKVGREYMVNVFNGFINAWFDYWFLQISISYGYAGIWEWLNFFLVFCITIFPEQAQNKNKVGIKTTFLLMMKILKAKGPTQARFRLGRDERIFWKAVNNKRNYLNIWVVEETSKATQLRLTTSCVATWDTMVQ